MKRLSKLMICALLLAGCSSGKAAVDLPEGMDELTLRTVRNDSTGGWRLAQINDADLPDDYAYEYYQAYLKGNDDISLLAIVNRATGTTTSITNADPIVVTTYEYVDGEEHDATDLFSGQKLTEVFIGQDGKVIE